MRIATVHIALVFAFLASLTRSEVYLFEDFEDKEQASSRWIKSEAKKIDSTNMEVFRYDGEWSFGEMITFSSNEKNHGLVMNSVAKHHAISSILEKPFYFDSPTKSFVIQYEVKFNNSLSCGGAYMKLLTFSEEFEPKSFDDKTPYTIMFGPDKCGSNQRVHFIFRHKNPLSGQFFEKHMTSAPVPILNQQTNLYTLILTGNNYRLLMNDNEVRSGSLLEDFQPPVNPPKEIDDPLDTKPVNWVDEKKIPDPNAAKPEDWDEDEPYEIEDPDATMPSDWLLNESPNIPDPSSQKPEDWNDEDDGEWEPPIVPNPKCEAVSGCGEWTKPKKRNPLYKGKWNPPQIDNPDYMGEWKPRKIANPDYFQDLEPYKMTPIGAIGMELWTMQNIIIFDNILVTDNVEEATQKAKDWRRKFELEESLKPKKSPGIGQEIIGKIWKIVDGLIDDPIETMAKYPLQSVVILLSPFLIIGIIALTFNSKPPKPRENSQNPGKEKEKEE